MTVTRMSAITEWTQWAASISAAGQKIVDSIIETDRLLLLTDEAREATGGIR
jgi:hypothetical protein